MLNLGHLMLKMSCGREVGHPFHRDVLQDLWVPGYRRSPSFTQLLARPSDNIEQLRGSEQAITGLAVIDEDEVAGFSNS